MRNLLLCALALIGVSSSAQAGDWHFGLGAADQLDDRNPSISADGPDAETALTAVAGIEVGQGFGVEASWVDLGEFRVANVTEREAEAVPVLLVEQNLAVVRRLARDAVVLSAGKVAWSESYDGAFITKCAMRLAPMLFVRPGELRHAEWSEINLEAAEWRIPAVKMKGRVMHIVPLATQALAILEELKPLTGRSRWVFPGVRTNGEPMSENTINAALRRLGYDKETMTGHDFRASARTLMDEVLGMRVDLIEHRLHLRVGVVAAHRALRERRRQPRAVAADTTPRSRGRPVGARGGCHWRSRMPPVGRQ